MTQISKIDQFTDKSAPYPQLERANAKELAASLEWLESAEQLFPKGCKVIVTHWRGQYVATVIRHDSRNHVTFVRNDKTGKESRVYPGMRSGISPNSTPCLQRSL